MNYYRMIPRFENDEAGFSVQEPYRGPIFTHHLRVKLLKSRPKTVVKYSYSERGMSDFLKTGGRYVASKQVQELFIQNGIQGIQFVPVDVINDDKTYTNFASVNVYKSYPLLDPIASEAEDYCSTLEQYTYVYDVIIDESKFNNIVITDDIFTLTEFRDTVIVSDKLKVLLESEKITGVKFKELEFA